MRSCGTGPVRSLPALAQLCLLYASTGVHAAGPAGRGLCLYAPVSQSPENRRFRCAPLPHLAWLRSRASTCALPSTPNQSIRVLLRFTCLRASVAICRLPPSGVLVEVAAESMAELVKGRTRAGVLWY